MQLARMLIGWTVRGPTTEALGKVVEIELAHSDSDEDSDDLDDLTESPTRAASAPGSEGHDLDDAVRALLSGAVLLRTKRVAAHQHQGVTWRGTEEHTIPLVDALVPYVDPHTRTLLADLPPGFMELGRRQMLVDYLGQALLPYASGPASGGSRPKPPPSHVAMRPDGVPLRVMPTQAVLRVAGRDDLCRLVAHAGGFSSVAASLGWAASRRPHGYWDDPGNLDSELDAFLVASWLELKDDSGGYFYNPITGEIRSEPPWPPPDSTVPGRRWYTPPRVVPTLSQLQAAGRTDLLHAVRQFGGLTAVADILDRTLLSQHTRSRALATDNTALRKELDALAEELGQPGTAPTQAQLVAAGRSDLARVLQLRGGLATTAAELGLSTHRHGRGVMADVDCAACAVLDFILQQLTPLIHSSPGAKLSTHERTPRASPAASPAVAPLTPTSAATRLPKLRQEVADAYARLTSVLMGPGGQAKLASRLPGSATTGRLGWPAGLPRLPSTYVLLTAQRFDLVYALKLHGRRALDERCGLADLRRGVASSHPAEDSAGSRAPRALVLSAVATMISPPGATADLVVAPDGPPPGTWPRMPRVTCAGVLRALEDQGLHATRQQVRGVLGELCDRGLLVKDDSTRGQFRATAWLQGGMMP